MSSLMSDAVASPSYGPSYTDRSEEEPEASPRKRQKKIGTDLISSLPDQLLHHILTFLDIDQAMRTSILSKRWQFVWTSMADFTFSQQGCRLYVDQFVALVHRTLLLCNSGKLNKLAVEFDYAKYNDRFAADVDAWLRFATQRKVVNLELLLNSAKISDDDYKLPQHLYINSSLRNLRLSSVKVLPSGIVGWKALKSLTLKSPQLTEEGMSKMLAGSPVLESLKMEDFEFIGHVNIYSTSLKELVIRTRDGRTSNEFELEISAPNLQSLHVFWQLDGTNFRLLDVSSLVSAYIDFTALSLRDTNKLLQSIGHVKELALGIHCIRAFSKLDYKGSLLHFPSNLKVFKVDVCNGDDIVHYLSGLLRCTQNLETLFIKMCDCPGPPCLIGKGKRWEFLGKSLRGSGNTLKTVKISGDSCYQRNCILELVKFLLKNAMVLEKMVVSGYFSSPHEYIEGAQELLCFPRSSPKAVVIFFSENKFSRY